jgi:hypothetical protein
MAKGVMLNELESQNVLLEPTVISDLSQSDTQKDQTKHIATMLF